MSTRSKLTVAALLTFSLGLYLAMPLEWGLMDDSEYVGRIHELVASHGFVSGVAARVAEHAAIDYGFAGVLRPSFWAYTALVYLLPVELAYFLRWLLLCGMAFFIFRIFRVNRSLPATWTTLGAMATLLSVRSLHDGLALVSLQEFTGLFFCLAGFSLLIAPISVTKRATAVALFLIALGVGFKPPFIWVWIALGAAYIFWKRSIRLGIVLVGSGILYLAFAVWLAGRGTYSQAIYQPGADRAFVSLVSFAKHFAPPLLAMLLVLAGFVANGYRFPRAAISGWQRYSRAQALGLVMLGAGLLYWVTLLPRGIGPGLGYYFSPAIVFILLGTYVFCVFGLVRGAVANPYLPRIFAIGAVCVALAVTIYSTHAFYSRNQGVLAVREWARQMRAERPTVAVNSLEAGARLQEILRLRLGADWQGSFVPLIDGNQVPSAANYYLVFRDQAAPATRAQGKLLWRVGSASLYEIAR